MGLKFPDHPIEAYGFTPEQMALFKTMSEKFPHHQSRHIAQAVIAKKTPEKVTAVLNNLTKLFRDCEWEKASIQDMDEIERSCPTGMVALPVQVKDSYGALVMCMKYSLWLPGNVKDQNALVRAFLIIYEDMLSQDVAGCLNGISFAADCKDFGWKNFDKQMEKMFMDVMVNSYPCKAAHTYLTNPGPILKAAIKIMMAFMPKKVAEKMVTLKTNEELQKYVHPDGLPREYSGNLNYNMAQWRGALDANLKKYTV